MRLLLSIAAHQRLVLVQADVEGAYLNGTLDEEIYLAFPDGLVPDADLPNGGKPVLRLRKSIYGLKQSGRTWWLELGRRLKEIGFEPLDAEPGLYSLNVGKDYALLLAYVDDLLIAATSGDLVTRILTHLRRYWPATSGAVEQFLGLKIERPSADTILVSQGSKIREVADEHLGGHDGDSLAAAGRYAPMAKHEDPATIDSSAFPNTKLYQRIVGELNWIACGRRPDVAYAVSWLARANKEPTEHHFCVALRVVRFLAGTADYALELKGNTGGRGELGEPILSAFSDADLGGDPQTGRSTSGLVLCLGGSPIVWRSIRQKSVARSTTEAEYMAASEASREVVVARTILESLGFPQSAATTLFVDNQSAIKLTRSAVSHSRTSHIDRHYHYIRELVSRDVVALEHIDGGRQIADVLTKALSGPDHKISLNQLRIVGHPPLQK